MRLRAPAGSGAHARARQRISPGLQRPLHIPHYSSENGVQVALSILPNVGSAKPLGLISDEMRYLGAREGGSALTSAIGAFRPRSFRISAVHFDSIASGRTFSTLMLLIE